MADPLLTGVATGLGSLAVGANPFLAGGLALISFLGTNSANRTEEEFRSQQAALAALQGSRAQAAARTMLQANKLQKAKDVFDIIKARRQFANAAVAKDLFIQSAASQLGLRGSSVSRAARTAAEQSKVSQINTSVEEQAFQDDMFRLQQEKLLILGGFVDTSLDTLNDVDPKEGLPLDVIASHIFLSFDPATGLPNAEVDPFVEFEEFF